MWPVDKPEFLKTRVSADIKRLVRRAAGEQLLTESVWLRRTVLGVLSSSAESSVDVASVASVAEPRSARLYVRLRTDDQLLLQERAAARGLRASTYLSVLARAHLRNLPPLPKEELLALKKATSELAALGRSVNQIARAANQDGRTGGMVRDELRAILRVCEALRDHTKALIRTNLVSWQIGQPSESGRLP
jgi:uncharacterized protein (DUF1778 family)